MSRVLLASSPLYGHVLPLTTIGAALRARGHDVTLLTGRAYRGQARQAGLAHVALPAAVDVDDAGLHALLRAGGPRTRIGRARQVIIDLFVTAIGPQFAALQSELANGYDVVLADSAFLGVLPLLVQGDRPPVFGVSATPLALRSVDCAPFGSGLAPGTSTFTRRRNVQIDWLLRHGPLRAVQTALDAQLAPYGVPAGAVNYFDTVIAADLVFHLGPAALEYPRRELPDRLRFVGPLRYTGQSPVASTAADGGDTAPVVGGVDAPALPTWWPDVVMADRVVHVTQGTLDTGDLGKVLVPTLQGLADTDALVVASTGGRPVRALLDRLSASLPGGLPDNARVAEFLPYDLLLPHTDVMVTNGGYGGVQRALAHGVPLVVAGADEDKPEVAARVDWAGVGRDLRTGRPRPRTVARAVHAVLTRPEFGAAAARLRDEIAALGDPVETIDAAVSACGHPPRRPQPRATMQAVQGRLSAHPPRK